MRIPFPPSSLQGNLLYANSSCYSNPGSALSKLSKFGVECIFHLERPKNIKKTRRSGICDGSRKENVVGIYLRWWYWPQDKSTSVTPGFQRITTYRVRGKVKKAQLRRWNEQKISFIQSCLSRAHYQIMCAPTTKKLLGRVYRRRMAAVCGLAKSNASFEFYQIQNDTISWHHKEDATLSSITYNTVLSPQK